MDVDAAKKWDLFVAFDNSLLVEILSVHILRIRSQGKNIKVPNGAYRLPKVCFFSGLSEKPIVLLNCSAVRL